MSLLVARSNVNGVELFWLLTVLGEVVVTINYGVNKTTYKKEPRGHCYLVALVDFGVSKKIIA